MKRTTRLIAAMLCIMLAFGCLAPASAAAAKLLQTGGSFYLTASTATATIIEPVRVDYAHGQTVKEALQASGFLSWRLSMNWLQLKVKWLMSLSVSIRM